MFDSQPVNPDDEKLKTDLKTGDSSETQVLTNKTRQTEDPKNKLPNIQHAPVLESEFFDNKNERIISVSALPNNEFKLPAATSKFIRFTDGSIFIAPSDISAEKIIAHAQKSVEDIADGGTIVNRENIPRKDNDGNQILTNEVALVGLLTDPLPEKSGVQFNRLDPIEFEALHEETVKLLQKQFSNQKFIS